MSAKTGEGSNTPWRPVSGGLAISVRLTPKSSRDAIDGVQVMSDGRAVIAARVRAVPDKGKANGALIKLLAGWFGLPAASLRIVSGHTSRLKTAVIEGDADRLAEDIRQLIDKL